MRYVLLMSHGHLASGMKCTVEMIVGKMENLLAFDAYVDGNDNVKQFIEDFLEKHPNEEVIIVTDVLGGSVNNEMLNYNNLPQVNLISGMNVPLVVNLLLNIGEELKTTIEESVETGREAVRYFEKVEKELEEDF